MKKLKVFGGRYSGKESNYKQRRMIVAAYTQKQVVELSGLSITEIRNYWGETGNKYELEIANEVGVWIYDKTGTYLNRIK
jgi:hypothetical protein